MRSRDVKVGQKVKITLSKKVQEQGYKGHGRLGTVYGKVGPNVLVTVPGVVSDQFCPRELQLKKGKK